MCVYLHVCILSVRNQIDFVTESIPERSLFKQLIQSTFCMTKALINRFGIVTSLAHDRCDDVFSYIPCRVGSVGSVSASRTVSSPLGRVIPKTIIKMVQTASLHRHAMR